MIFRFLLCSLIILGTTLVAQAQLQKGSWMVNGVLQQENFTFPDARISSAFNLLLAPELAYMVTDHLMLGGKLSIGLSGNELRRFAPVSQTLLVRHYFKQLDNYHLFYGGELFFEKRTDMFTGGGNRITNNRSANLQCGLQVFLQSSIALEFLFNYEVITSRTVRGQFGDFSDYDSGPIILEGRLQFFIHKNKQNLTEKTDYRFYPGDWLLGGNFEMGDRTDFIKPEVHRFWGSGWTTGLRLRMELSLQSNGSRIGGTTLVRKYFRPEKKGKIWLQAGAGILGSYSRRRDRQTEEERWTTDSRTLSLEGVIGWSNLISPNFSLDFFVARKHQNSYQWNGSSRTLKVFSMGLIVSGLLRK